MITEKPTKSIKKVVKKTVKKKEFSKIKAKTAGDRILEKSDKSIELKEVNRPALPNPTNKTNVLGLSVQEDALPDIIRECGGGYMISRVIDYYLKSKCTIVEALDAYNNQAEKTAKAKYHKERHTNTTTNTNKETPHTLQNPPNDENTPEISNSNRNILLGSWILFVKSHILGVQIWNIARSIKSLSYQQSALKTYENAISDLPDEMFSISVIKEIDSDTGELTSREHKQLTNAGVSYLKAKTDAYIKAAQREERGMASEKAKEEIHHTVITNNIKVDIRDIMRRPISDLADMTS